MDWSGYKCGCKSHHVQCATCYTPARDGLRKRLQVILRGQSGSVESLDCVLIDRVIDSKWSITRILRHWERRHPGCEIEVTLVRPAHGGTRVGDLTTGEGRIG